MLVLVWKEATAAMTALVYFYTSDSFYSWDCTLYIHVHKPEPCTAVQQRETGLHRAPPLYCTVYPAISLHTNYVSLVQWTNPLLPDIRDPGSNPLGGY